MLTLLLMALAAGPLTDAVERGISESLARARAPARAGVRDERGFNQPKRRPQPNHLVGDDGV